MSLTEDIFHSAFLQDVTVPEDKDFMGKEKAKDEEPRVCEICKGCKHTLEELNHEVSIFNSTYKHRTGYSSAWVYKIYPSCNPKGAANYTGEAFASLNNLMFCLIYNLRHCLTYTTEHSRLGKVHQVFVY